MLKKRKGWLLFAAGAGLLVNMSLIACSDDSTSTPDTGGATADSGMDQTAALDQTGGTEAGTTSDTSTTDGVVADTMTDDAMTDDAVVDGVGSDTTALVGDEFNGGVVWNKYWETRAGGSGALPTGFDSANKDFLRCKSCHGWDGLGADGGYVRRTAKATRPNPTTGTNLSAKFGTVTAADVLHAGGRAFATLDKTHPDYSKTGGLTAQQVADVVAFLNSGARVQDVATLDTSKTPVEYTFTGADTAAGKTLYDNKCASCHGADGKTLGTMAIGPFFSADGKYSEGFIKIVYGEAAGPMARAALGNLTKEQARDVLAYIQANIPGTFPTN